MKAFLCSGLVLLTLATICVSSAVAQTPTITVYFDGGYSQRVKDCPGPGLDTLYVVAENWGAYLSAMEFKVDYPPEMTWLADLDLPPVSFGNTASGVSMGFGIPQNAFLPLLVTRVLVLWNCTDCSAANSKLAVVPHPLFGYVRATMWPTQEYIIGEGGGSAVCQFVNLDIKPRSCPNPFNRRLWDFVGQGKPQKGGVLPVAVLGSATFDVNDIDLSTLRLEGVEPLSQGGGPTIKDVATPIGEVEDCECATYGPDGVDDVSMKFNAQDIAAVVPPGNHKDTRVLTLTGQLTDGTPFEASDCITIVGNKKSGTPFGRFYEPELGPPTPNPFNPVTRITFALPASEHVSLVVYDVAGRRVEVLASGTYGEGEHIVEWDASELPSGVYYYRLIAGDHSLVRRATVLK